MSQGRAPSQTEGESRLPEIPKSPQAPGRQGSARRRAVRRACAHRMAPEISVPAHLAPPRAGRRVTAGHPTNGGTRSIAIIRRLTRERATLRRPLAGQVRLNRLQPELRAVPRPIRTTTSENGLAAPTGLAAFFPVF